MTDALARLLGGLALLGAASLSACVPGDRAAAPVAAPAPPAAPANPMVALARSATATVTRTEDEQVGIGSSLIARVERDGEQQVLAESATVPARGEQAVLGEVADVRPATAPARATRLSDDDGLPFTGMQAGLLALIGAGIMLAGFALHRASAVRQPR